MTTLEGLVDELGALELELLSLEGPPPRPMRVAEARAAATALTDAVAEVIHCEPQTRDDAIVRARHAALIAWAMLANAHEAVARARSQRETAVQMRTQDLARRARALRQRAILRWRAITRERRHP
jgi:hypothetical protein